MPQRVKSVVDPKYVKFIAAVLVGLSVGTLVSPTAVDLPLAGATPGVVVGFAGLLFGTILYRWVPALFVTSDCGCSGDCGCS